MRLATIISLIFVGTHTAKAQTQTSIYVSPDAKIETIYQWKSDRCRDVYIPDTPVRAFRRFDGHMVLIASHFDNWALEGAGFDALRPSCQPLLDSQNYRKSGLGKAWISATYTRDGRNVLAFLSHDLSEMKNNAECKALKENPGQCWANDLLIALSDDGGKTFRIPEEDAVIASVGSQYPRERKNRFGVFTASNIVSHNGAAYTLVWLDGSAAQGAGNCLLRSDNPFDARSWLAWDGQGFTVRLEGEGSRGRCSLVDRSKIPAEVRSLQFDTRSKHWVAVYSARVKLATDEHPQPGFHYSTSPDLMSWSAPRRIARMSTRPREDQASHFVSYPALLDPNSSSRNFDTIEHDDVVITFTTQHLSNGMGTMDRDLNFMRVQIR